MSIREKVLINGEEVQLSDDTLTNIYILSPKMDNEGRAATYGLICGLLKPQPVKDDKEAG